MYRILSNIIINKFGKIEIKLQQLCIEYMNTIAYFIFYSHLIILNILK